MRTGNITSAQFFFPNVYIIISIVNSELDKDMKMENRGGDSYWLHNDTVMAIL